MEWQELVLVELMEQPELGGPPAERELGGSLLAHELDGVVAAVVVGQELGG